MKQQPFTDFEYNQRPKKTRREKFLDAMEAMIPWSAWIAMILPFYPSGKRGHPVKGIETMLRMYLMQIWLNLSDVAIEDAIYDSYAMRSFMCIDFNEEQFLLDCQEVFRLCQSRLSRSREKLQPL